MAGSTRLSDGGQGILVDDDEVADVESLVRGETRDILAARELAAKVCVGEETAQGRLRVATTLMYVPQQLASGANRDELNVKFDRLIEQLNPGALIEDERTGKDDAARHVTPDCKQPAVKVPLHSTGAASRLAALLLGQILPVFFLVASCQSGASPVSVQRRTFTADC